MKILAIGDIYGKTGRKVLKSVISEVIKENGVDLVIANVENTTHGKGLIKRHYQELKECGIQIMTSGNHIFSCEETREFISDTKDLLRPLNSCVFHPGEGTVLTKHKGKKIRITNLIGTDLMPSNAENPYFCLEKVLETDNSDIHLVDFHAEATAEKIALALYYDGKISALWGTHTHVQTADERILPKGTGFITDIGMTGPYNGVIGADPNVVWKRAKYGFMSRMAPLEDKEGQFNAVLFVFSEDNKLKEIKRIIKLIK